MIVKTITTQEHPLLQPTTKRGKIIDESEKNSDYNLIVTQPTTKGRKVGNKNEQNSHYNPIATQPTMRKTLLVANNDRRHKRYSSLSMMVWIPVWEIRVRKTQLAPSLLMRRYF